jgi:hypothetical protein
MSIQKKMRWFLLLPVLLVAVLALAPWQTWVQQKLIATLEAQGYGPVTLTLDHIGYAGIALRDVTLGEPPLKLAHVTVGYQPRDLLKGKLNAVRMNGLSVNITQDASGWSIEGLPVKPAGKNAEVSAPMPLNETLLNRLPFAQLQVAESSIHVAAKTFGAQMPLDIKFEHGAANTVQLDSANAQVRAGATAVDVGAIALTLALDHAAQQWQGNWSLKDIRITSESLTVPTLHAAGTVSVGEDAVHFMGSISSDDKSYEAAFAGEYAFAKPTAATLKIVHAHVPWSGGVIATTNATLPLHGSSAIALTLEVQHVAINTLMQALTGNQGTATGVVSGNLPLRISKTGAISVGKTSLTAEGPGIITLSPEAIPGDNAQVGMVRDVLKNLHYTVLALELNMAPDNTLSASLAVEGANPDAQGGRPVKLHVQLSGDLLNFVLQNTQLMTDPKSFIEQKNHE